MAVETLKDALEKLKVLSKPVINTNDTITRDFNNQSPVQPDNGPNEPP